MNCRNTFFRFCHTNLLTPASLSFFYVVFALLWIFGSGHLLTEHIKNPLILNQFELGKGVFFVIFTGGLLHLLLRSWYKKLVSVQNQMSATLDAIPDLLFEVDLEGRYYDYHSSRTHLLAAAPEVLLGKKIKDILPPEAAKISLLALQEAHKKGFSYDKQIELLLPEGKKWFELSISKKSAPQAEIPRFIVLSRDITERKKAEARILYLANFDGLTGLPNRSQIDDRAKYALTLAKRNNRNLAVMFFDLDHFKNINDTLGHSIGDLLLIDVATRIQSILSEEDTLSRTGGDEFIVLLPDSDAYGATQVAQKLLDSIIQPFLIQHHELTITASIGIALYPEDGLDMETLSKNADTAMYRVKDEGRNEYRFFTEEMQKNSTHNLQLGNALRHALERNELHLVYQPQISTSGTPIIGAEALLRWHHPLFGNVPPSEFIPIAEENGMILSIGEWVLRTAITQAKMWMDNGHLPMIMAVNISAVQFRHPNLPDLVTSILEEIGLPSQYLELELTESIAMHNPQEVIAIMNKLHERGIRMSIDDFGTGYSSLSYLKKFQVYKLKIDQSFIRDISTDPEDKAIVAAIISMAHSLGLQTIAEGVETVEQLQYLREQGCDEIQGYYYSKPLLPEQFEQFLYS